LASIAQACGDDKSSLDEAGAVIAVEMPASTAATRAHNLVVK